MIFSRKVNFLFVLIVPILLTAFYYHLQQRQLQPYLKKVEEIRSQPVASSTNQATPAPQSTTLSQVTSRVEITPKEAIEIQRQAIELKNKIDSTAIQMFGGAFFLVTAFISWLNYQTSENKQVSERFEKAIAQLGSEQPELKIGAIFALERLAKDSPKDHWTIIEVLTAYLRERSHQGLSTEQSKPIQEEQDKVSKAIAHVQQKLSIRVSQDVQAVLTVLGRRNTKLDPKNSVINLTSVDFRGADLSNVKLTQTDFRFACLERTLLSEANLKQTNLDYSDLTLANLDRSNLRQTSLRNIKALGSAENADLEQADLTGANLSSANLKGVNLKRARLLLANLQEAKLQGADLSSADLRFANLRRVQIDQKTRLSEKWNAILLLHRDGGQDKFLVDKDFRDADLWQMNFHGSILKRVCFDRSILTGSIFADTTLYQVTFRDSENSDCSPVKNQIFQHLRIFFDSCRNKLKVFSGLETSAKLTKSFPKLELADFRGSKLKNTIFSGAFMATVNFENSELENVTFENVYLQDSRFINAKLKNVIFKGSSLTRVSFSSVHRDSKTIKFENCCFENVNYPSCEVGI